MAEAGSESEGGGVEEIPLVRPHAKMWFGLAVTAGSAAYMLGGEGRAFQLLKRGEDDVPRLLAERLPALLQE